MWVSRLATRIRRSLLSPDVRSTAETNMILTHLIQGWSLRSHRDIDGNKQFVLCALDGERVQVDGAAVHQLREKRLIETNHKFPSATFLLTEQGERVARTLSGDVSSNPVTAQNFVTDL